MFRPIKTLIAISLLTLPFAANAGLVLDLNTGGTANPCGGGCASGTTFGWSFSVVNSIKINQLGLWDAGADGLGVSSAQVGLWSTSGSLLANATITDASEQVASASANGEWLFENISSVLLTPGDYLIGSVFLNPAPFAQIGATFTTIANITFGGGVRGAENAGLSIPDQSFDRPIFGATMRSEDSSVPEPTSVALVGLGLAVMSMFRRLTRTTV
jgi:hypothetical protein